MLNNTLQMNNRKKPLIWSVFGGVKALFATVFNWCIKGGSGTPDMDFQSVDKVQQGEKFYKRCQISPRETLFSNCKPEENRLERCKHIFNKRNLMLKIHRLTRDYSKPKNTETQSRTGIARNNGIEPELDLCPVIRLNLLNMSKMGMVKNGRKFKV